MLVAPDCHALCKLVLPRDDGDGAKPTGTGQSPGLVLKRCKVTCEHVSGVRAVAICGDQCSLG